MTTAPPTSAGALAPLRHRAFRWLWLGVVVSSTGVWMQTVGAQWFLVSQPRAATLVSLVQAANTLPVLLMALPGGVLADSFDRRWLLLATQVHVLVVAAVLTTLTFLGQMTAPLLLVFTFLLGMGLALQLPTWNSMIPDLVSRNEIGAATRLDMVAVNLSRAVGPAVGGLVIAASSIPVVFGLNALSVLPLMAILLAWRGRPVAVTGPRERFLPAVRAGGRFVRHSVVVRRILVRLAAYVMPAAALWALLPLIASQVLGLGAAAYGFLFGALGAGAVIGAFVLGRLRDRLTSNTLLGLSMALYAAGLAALVTVPSAGLALGVLVVTGLGWTAVASTLIAELQTFLPAWVRARGMAIFLMTFTGSQVVGSVLWGQVAERLGPRDAVLWAVAGVVAAALLGLVVRVPEIGHLDREPAAYWTDPVLAVDPDPGGRVIVLVECTVTPERQAGFLAAMQRLRGVRLRTGASRWDLHQDLEDPTHFVEVFSVPSWEEHLRQHHGRLVGSDREIEEAALAFSDPPARARHLMAPRVADED